MLREKKQSGRPARKYRAIPPHIMADDVMQRMEQATALPLRLAYVALMVYADRNGVFIPDPEWLETTVAPLDRWDWGAILDCLDACGYIGWFAHSDGKRYAAFVGWRRLQAPCKSEKAYYPQPLWSNKLLTPLFTDPARWVRRRPPPHGFTKDQRAELVQAAGALVPLDPEYGLDVLWEVMQQGVTFEAVIAALRKWCPSLSTVMRSWCDPWLIAMARRETVLLPRLAKAEAKELYAEHDRLIEAKP